MNGGPGNGTTADARQLEAWFTAALRSAGVELRTFGGTEPAEGQVAATGEEPDKPTGVRSVTVSADGVGTPVVDVPAEGWVAAATCARDQLGMDFLDWLSAVDEPEGDPAGLDVVLHLAATDSFGIGHRTVRRVLLRTRVPNSAPTLPSLTSLWPGVAWHERETFEMFGLAFTGFEDGTAAGLRPLLLPDGFEGTPLRKSFMLAARAAKAWPGAKDPGDSGAKAPARRKTLPPGVPDPSWGPHQPGTPREAPAPARPARTPRAGAAGAAGRPARTARAARAAAANPEAAPASSEEAAANPAGATTSPEEAAANPAGAATKPGGASANTEADATKPAGAPASPEGATAKPEGGVAKLEGSATEPEARAAKPEGGAPRPESAAAPNPATPITPTPNTTGPAPKPNAPDFTPTPNALSSTPTPETTAEQEAHATKPEPATPNPATPITPEPNASRPTPEPDLSRSTPKPDAPDSIPKPDAPSATPKPDVPGSAPKQNATDSTPKPNAPSATPKPDVPSSAPKPNATDSTPKPDADA